MPLDGVCGSNGELKMFIKDVIDAEDFDKITVGELVNGGVKVFNSFGEKIILLRLKKSEIRETLKSFNF